MPIAKPRTIPTSRQELYELGRVRVKLFCQANNLVLPSIFAMERSEWHVDACAYYRKDCIKICLAECARPCTGANTRNWNWPGSTIDREPYGVLCHELGHHCDLYAGVKKGAYYSEFCEQVQAASGEPPITTYCPNPAEWFAEIFRLFITNHALLKELRPKAWALLRERFKPVSRADWVAELGTNVPSRVVRSQEMKIRKGA